MEGPSFVDHREGEAAPSSSSTSSTSSSSSTSCSSSGRRRAVLLSYGAFCPIHLNHVAMLSLAKAHLERVRNFEVVAAVMCPTSDGNLRKKYRDTPGGEDGFVPAEERGKMMELATKGVDWIKVDLWPARNNAPASRTRQHVVMTYNEGRTDQAQCLVISVFGPDTLQRIKSLKNSNAAMVCVVNRRYEFDPVELVNEKGGSRSARIEGESDCFLDIVSANDEAIGQDFSSTIIRQALLQNQLEKCQHLLHPVVIEYIKEKRLFSPLGRKGGPSMTLEESIAAALPDQRIDKVIKWEQLENDNGDATSPKILGTGISSEIYAMKLGGVPVAVKVYSLNNEKERPVRTMKFFYNEINILKKFNHVHVVRYFGAGIDYDNLRCFVVMERADDSLKSLLDRRAMQMTETTERKNWTHGDQPTNEMQEHYELSKKAMLDVARGMEALHDVGVIHRDIGIANILVFYSDNDCTFKITDFGLSQALDEREHLVTIRGSMRHYAPEAINATENYTYASDVFMFGMVMYEVLEGRVPYDGLATGLAIKKKLGGARPPVSAMHSSACGDYVKLMRRCWDHDPNMRPTFGEIIARLEGSAKDDTETSCD